MRPLTQPSAAPARLPGRRRPWLAATVVTLLVLAVDLRVNSPGLFDLRVYREGAVEVVGGTGRLYDFGVAGYPFTYPPVAAVLLVPLALMSATVAKIVWTAAMVPALVLIWSIVLEAAHRERPESREVAGWEFVGLVAASAVFVEPVTHTIHLGQVNVFLLGALLLDLVGPVPERWRGLLTGLAAAVKLTPLVFLAYLAVTCQWKALRNATAAFGAAACVGIALLPGESWRYWTGLVMNVSRVGPIASTRNQSVMGTVLRLGIDQGSPAATVFWGVSVCLLAGAALLLAVMCEKRGAHLLAVSLVGLTGLMASPVSWGHHWVWCIPLGAGLLTTGTWPLRTARAAWVAAVLWAAVFVVAPQSRFAVPGATSLQDGLGAQLISSPYLVAAVGVLMFVACQLAPRRPAAPPGAQHHEESQATGSLVPGVPQAPVVEP